MPKFTYTAIESSSGRDRSGTIESSSAEQATAELKARGLAPMSLVADTGAAPAAKKKTKPAAGPARAEAVMKRKPRRFFGRVVGAKALTVFTRQLATLVKAGMPIVRSLDVLARQERNLHFKAVLESLADTIRSGGNLSDGLAQHPRTFDRLYINMVKAGEAGGVLDTVLDRLSRFMEKAERTKNKVKTAMTYPLAIMVVATAIVAGLMVFVVPKFEQIFAGLLKGQSMPMLTLLVLGVSNFIKNHILITVGVLVALYFAFLAFRRTPVGTRVTDWLLIKMPVFGDLFLKASIARFTRTFGTLLASGVPILQALLITRDTSGNVHVANALQIVHDRVKEGDDVAKPLEATGIFPGMVTSMIEVGEETGALPDMLARIADTYDEEVDNAVAALTSILEPMMIVFMAVVVGTIVIALFLPIVSIIQHLQ
jgi:type IV pilus assembly protein PilC